jgi:hypothetical protein
MNKPRKAFVSIYCKIYTENFSDELIDRYATGKEIYDFLMKDAWLCVDKYSDPLPGDANIWYLGSNEKFGSLVYKHKIWNWGFGGSSFDIVTEFVQAIYDDELFTEAQYQNLMAKIEEGRQIGDMYAIGDYLYQKIHPQQGKEANYAV